MDDPSTATEPLAPPDRPSEETFNLRPPVYDFVEITAGSYHACALLPDATRWVLVVFVLLHTGIVLTSGIFVWKWVLLDLALFGEEAGIAGGRGVPAVGVGAGAGFAVGASNSIRNVTSQPQVRRSREMTRIATSECPPKSKKLS